MKKIFYWTIGLIVLLAVLATAFPTPPLPESKQIAATNLALAPTATTTEHSIPPSLLYPVIKVVDGDTLTINISGSSETVRLIGINTPETVDPRTTVECFGKEASLKAKELLTGKKVRIEKDPSQGDRDKYQRHLAYVYREDGLFVNKYMIEDGYAYEYTYNAPYKYQSEFKAAQAVAKLGKKGLWAPGVCDKPATSGTTPKPKPIAKEI